MHRLNLAVKLAIRITVKYLQNQVIRRETSSGMMRDVGSYKKPRVDNFKSGSLPLLSVTTYALNWECRQLQGNATRQIISVYVIDDRLQSCISRYGIYRIRYY